MANSIKIKVNGLTHGVTASLDTPLLYVLHNELHLHGPRFGCGLAQCGACSVLLDGKEIRSCVTPVAAVSGKSITTLEGLPALCAAQRGTTAAAPALHPLQQAWIDVQVPHCGYCQNGMMIQAADLLATTKNPTEDQIRTAMNGHLCRCGTYPRILTAIQKAAAVMAKGGASNHDGLHAREGVLAQVVPQGRRRARRRLLASPAPALAGKASAAASDLGRATCPTSTQVDSWITIGADNTVTLKMSQIETGNGITTGFLQVLAEELDMDMSQMRYGRQVDSQARHTPTRGSSARPAARAARTRCRARARRSATSARSAREDAARHGLDASSACPSRA